MLAVLEFVATLSTTLFCGAAIYINLVEHPARMECDTRIALTVWAPSYKRATVMQGGGTPWLAGAVLIAAVVPFTFIVIMPTNHRLLEPGRDPDSNETRELLESWGKLHGVRSALGFAASVVYVGSLLGA